MKTPNNIVKMSKLTNKIIRILIRILDNHRHKQQYSTINSKFLDKNLKDKITKIQQENSQLVSSQIMTG